MDGIDLRIKQLRDMYFDKNNVKMATELGTSEANIRNFINGSPPKVEFVIAICKKLEINYEWLLLGKGEMISSVTETKVDSNKKPSTVAADGFKERYILLLERTVLSLETKIAEMRKKP